MSTCVSGFVYFGVVVLFSPLSSPHPHPPTPPLKRVMGGLQQDQLRVRQRCSGLYPVRVWKPSRSLQSPSFLYLRLTQLSSMQIHWHETYAKTFNFFIPYTSAATSHISGTIQNLSSSLFEFSRTLPSYTYSDFTRCFSDIKWTKWNGIKISSLDWFTEILRTSA